MLISIFLLLFGLTAFLISSHGYRSFRKLKKVGLVTEATVIGYEEVISHSSDGKSTSYCPTLRFTTENGETLTVRSGGSYSKRKCIKMEKEKSQIEVIYNPDNPKSFSVNSRTEEFLPLVLSVIGFIVLVAGILGLAGMIDFPEVL